MEPILNIEDQFFLTLIKLRSHKANFEVSRLFKTSKTGVMNIFGTWINFMACQWGELRLMAKQRLGLNFIDLMGSEINFPIQGS